MSDLPLPPDHGARMERVRLALDGLSVGDALGEHFFNPVAFSLLFDARQVPGRPWRYTDDTEMALGIAEVLARHGRVEQDELAGVFARRYFGNLYRGYGGGMHQLLPDVARGVAWREAAGALFHGTGSMGNGGAMRAAPVGAYFADDLEAAAREARASAEVTHAHPEGQAGAIAVAVAAACAWQVRDKGKAADVPGLFDRVIAHTPEGPTRDGLSAARELPAYTPPQEAAFRLGNGRRVLAADTVPFTVWCAFRYLDDYEEAIWETISVLGDIDTNCAIVGGIVALAAGRRAIPESWLEAREPLAL